MAMIPQQPGAMPQAQPNPQMPQGAAQSGGYPADKKEIEQTKTNAVKLIYSQGFREMIMKALTGEDEAKLTKSLAAITAKILLTIADDIKKKTGRKPKISMIVHMAKFILTEIGMIARKVKVKLSKTVIQNAGVMAGDIIQQTVSSMGQKQRQAPGQPNAQPSPPMQPQASQMPPQQPAQGQPTGLLSTAMPPRG